MRCAFIIVGSLSAFALSVACSSSPKHVEPAEPAAPPHAEALHEAPRHEAQAANAAAAEKSLFDRLGGLPAIQAVVTEFYQNVAQDERINAPFAMVDLETLRQHLIDFVCAATGGPCKYTGRSMKESHLNMGVTSAQFDALVGDLVAALDKFNVPEKEKGELLGALGPLKKDIVEVE
jgi:hemoglobin